VSRLSLAGVSRAAVAFAVLSIVPFVLGEHWVLNMFIFTLMYAGLASAWNLVGGFTGYISLGHAAFFGVGAYAIGVTFTHWGIGGGYRPFYVLPLVGLGTAIASVPVAWIALRTRAATFAIVTITLLFVVQQLAFNLHSLTGGSQGISLPPPPFPLAHFEWPFYYAMLGTLAVAMLATWYVRGSRLGLHLFTIRDDEDRARGIGVPVTGVKVLAFAISVGLTAMFGGVWAYYIAFIYPQFAVDPLVTIGMVLMVYLGGKGTIWGPVLGAFILVPAQQYLAYRLGASEFYLVGYAAVFLVIMLVLPRGILPSIADLHRRYAGRVPGPLGRLLRGEKAVAL
jgi:branched-chain amino acid transport system permease protein